MQTRSTFGSEKENYSQCFNSINLAIPFRIDSDYIVVSPSFDYNKIITVGRDFNLKMSKMSLSWLHTFDGKWSSLIVFIPRTASANSEWISKFNMQYGGVVLVRYKNSPTLRYSLGLYYNSEFFGPFFIPLAGINWKINTNWQLYGVIPNSLTLDRVLTSRLHASIVFTSTTNSYRRSPVTFIKVEENELRLSLLLYIKKIHVLSLEGGHSILRKVQTGLRITDKPSYNNLEFNDGWLIRLGYSIRIPE